MCKRMRKTQKWFEQLFIQVDEIQGSMGGKIERWPFFGTEGAQNFWKLPLLGKNASFS